MTSRLTSAVLVLALVGAGSAPCAGWESTPEARLDCCVDGQCPGQIEADGHAATHSGGVSQAEADRCCATSEQQNQRQSTQFAGPTFLLPAPAAIVVVAAADLTPRQPTDPFAVRVLSPPARLHLLFSVFLV